MGNELENPAYMITQKKLELSYVYNIIRAPNIRDIRGGFHCGCHLPYDF